MSAHSTTSRAAALREAFDRSFALKRAAPQPEEAFLLVGVAGARCALPLAEVAGLYVDRKIAPIPTRVASFVGIASLRSALVPIYSLRALLGPELAVPCRWIVLVRGSEPLGLAIEAFERQALVPTGRMSNAPASAASRAHVCGAIQIEEGVCPVIDIRAVAETIATQARRDSKEEV